jgi:phosphohistidine phosphatase
MASDALVPDRVLTSRAARTRETGKFAAPAFKRAPVATPVERLYDATPHDILGIIKGAPPAARSLLVLGHNPGLHAVALLLVASGDIETRERLREKMPTCGLVVIDFAFDDWAKLHPQSGRLERFVSPKSLSAGAN